MVMGRLCTMLIQHWHRLRVILTSYKTGAELVLSKSCPTNVFVLCCS